MGGAEEEDWERGSAASLMRAPLHLDPHADPLPGDEKRGGEGPNALDGEETEGTLSGGTGEDADLMYSDGDPAFLDRLLSILEATSPRPQVSSPLLGALLPP